MATPILPPAAPAAPAAPVLAFLPAVLDHLSPSRIVYDSSKYWVCYGRNWTEIPKHHIRQMMADALREIIQRRPDREIARAETSNKALREPLFEPLCLAIASRPFPGWNTDGRIAFIKENGYEIYDIELGRTRPIEPTDYIRVTVGHYPRAYQLIEFWKRAAVRQWAKDFEFLIDAIAHAMIGRPTDRFYLVYGDHAHDFMMMIQQTVLHSTYCRNIVCGTLERISSARPKWSYAEPIIHARIGILEDGIGRADPTVLQRLTDGSRRIQYGETVTYAQRCTLFCSYPVKEGISYPIRDPTLIERIVCIPAGSITPEIVSWGQLHGDDIFSYLCDRATEIGVTGQPPPLPRHIEWATSAQKEAWKMITVEEWLARTVIPGEGTLMQSHIHGMYRMRRDTVPLIEIVTQKLFYHLLEEHIGKKAKKGGYEGWISII